MSRDITLADTIYMYFTTRAFATGIPTVLAGTPVVSAYENDSVTQITAGITLGVSHDSVVGLNLLTIVATGANGYEAGKDYMMVITTGTVDGVSVVGEAVGEFQIGRSAAAVDTADMQPLIEKMAYVGSHGLGVWIDDGAANTNTVLGTDGTPDNPVSTIAAATTVATALGSQRFYLVNDTVITLAQTYEGYEFIGVGEMTANTINLGSQDVDNSNFENVLISGTQGGTGRFQAKGCVLSVIISMEISASACVMAAGTLTLRDDCMFDSCWSAVAGAGTPILDVNSVASVNVYFRHHSGGLQVNNAVATTVMSYEAIGQIIIDTTCTSLNIVPRGNCSVTDNGTTTNIITLDAAVNRTGINAEMDTALSDISLDKLVVATGTVETSGSNSSTQVQTDLAEVTNDHYHDIAILFTDGAEAGQWRPVLDYVGATGVVSWDTALTGTPADGTAFILLPAGTTAKAVWDRVLTGATHNITNSSGRRLRQVEESFVFANGTIATVTNGHTFTLDAGAVATADYYIGARLQITEGTGAGQSRLITGYTSGRVATLDSDYTTNPDTSSLYEIVAADVHVSLSDADLAEGFVAVATSTTTITLDAGAVATTDYYLGKMIIFTHGTGAGQAREITAYTSGRVVTMSPALTTAVGVGTGWHIASNGLSAAQVNAEVVDVIDIDTSGEPAQGAPPETASLRAKNDHVYKSWRNKKTNDGSTTELFDDAGTTVDTKQTTSEAAGTVTKSKWVTGP